MKYFVFFLTIALLCRCTPKDDSDFQGLKWGDRPSQIIKKEGRAPDDSSDKNVYVYGKDLFGVPMQLGYIFADSQFASAVYIPKDAGAMKDKIHQAYLKLSDSLTKAYGPSRDSTIAENNKFKKQWQNKNSNISIVYVKEGAEIFVFSIVSKKLEPLIDMGGDGPSATPDDTDKIKIEVK